MASLSPTGITGLDHILRGGLPTNRVYLLRGTPGTGKTTLALQYLLEGVRQGERCLYITLSETREEVEAVAQSHGWKLDGLAIFELSALEEQLKSETQNTVFHPSEIELNQTTEALLATIKRVQPSRIALDSLSELRLLADSALRYRRQILAFKQHFAGQKITVLLLDDHSGPNADLHVQSIAHGVISLEQLVTDYGSTRRRLRIEKLRGVNFVGGYHDAAITPGGLHVFPRLIAAEHKQAFNTEALASGNAALDTLIGGGLERGTSCLLLGPAGCGKSTLAMQFAISAAQRGEKVYYYLFEENLRTLVQRSQSLGMPVQPLIDSGMIVMRPVDASEMPPGQFVYEVQRHVERDGARVIVIDSLNGYIQAMSDVRYLSVQLHELQSFFNHHGVISLMTVAQHGVLGQMQAPVDVTYLADSVLLLRFFEHDGEIRKALSVVKKRTGRHESTIRELKFDPKGIQVGEPLREFQGILTGVPIFRGTSASMLQKR